MQIFRTCHCFAKWFHLFLFCYYAIPYLLSKKWLRGIKYHPAANSSQRGGEYVRWYCSERWKLICLCWHHLGIVQASYQECWSVSVTFCFCSFVLTASRNHVVLTQPRLKREVLTLGERGQCWNEWAISFIKLLVLLKHNGFLQSVVPPAPTPLLLSTGI